MKQLSINALNTLSKEELIEMIIEQQKGPQYNLILDADSYKLDHVEQLPDCDRIFSTIIARKPNKFTKEVVAMGYNYVIQKYLSVRVTLEMIEEAQIEAKEQGLPFNREIWEEIVEKYEGKLPLRIRAVPEGTVVPCGSVICTVENTVDGFAWLASYVETLIQRAVWKMSTVASVSRSIRKKLAAYLKKSGAPEWMLDFMLHNFGDRGADAHESAIMASMSHAAAGFKGTDCLQMNRNIKYYYNTTKAYGSSVVASEHSVMCSNADAANRDDYAAAVKMIDRLEKLLDERDAGNTTILPLVSIVSDTYDIYRFVKEFIGIRLRDRIIRLGERGGKVVIRPDSGDATTMPIQVIDMLMDAFGYTTNDKGYKELPVYIGAIQGDGINEESLSKILQNLEAKKYSLSNIVFGMGGGLTHEAGRDEFSFAMKATAMLKDGEWVDLFKDPITDVGKRSLRGRVTTYVNSEGMIFSERVELQEFNKQITDMMIDVYVDGEQLDVPNFDEVIGRATVGM